MRRRAALAVGGAALLGVGTGLATAWWRNRPDGADAEHPAARSGEIWETTALRPDGSRLALAEHRGRPLLVNFWATWCVPCVTELPLLDRFHAAQRARGANGWQVAALALDTSLNVVRFLAKTPLLLPIGILEPDAYDLPRRLGNAAGGLPFSIVLDAAGRIALRHLGAVDGALLDTWTASMN